MCKSLISKKNQTCSVKVGLSDYFIGETEVTQDLWIAVMGSNPSQKNGFKYPVQNVSWNDCQTFITKLNQLTGKTFRLPTEAEWEYAARGGNKSKGYKYSGSDNIEEVAWYYKNSDNEIHEVGTKKFNELGIYDMSGNVWEWCQDCYDAYSPSAQIDPICEYDSEWSRVLRDGNYLSATKYCRTTSRGSSNPKGGHEYEYYGFRLAQ